jgi:hypothetical protein
VTDVEITDPSYGSCTGSADTPHRRLILGELVPYKVHVIDLYIPHVIRHQKLPRSILHSIKYLLAPTALHISRFSDLGWVVTAPCMLLIKDSKRQRQWREFAREGCFLRGAPMGADDRGIKEKVVTKGMTKEHTSSLVISIFVRLKQT